MLNFLAISIQFLVLFKSFSAEDYETLSTDYSDDESDSMSKEMVKNETVNISGATAPTRQRCKESLTTISVTNGSIIDRNNVESARKTTLNYPFVASIQRKGAHYATGALLDSRWIITSAGEFFNVRESIKIFRARLGSVDCRKGGTVVPLQRVELHPHYRRGAPNFDVSLLRLAIPVELSNFIRPIGLSKITTKVISANFLTIYWPRIIVKNSVLPENAKERHRYKSMRVSIQEMIPREQCDKMINLEESLQKSAMCLRPFVTHHSKCTPDVGAPVVAEDGLWGIISGWTAINCRFQPSPTIFTRLSLIEISAWIDSQLQTTF